MSLASTADSPPAVSTTRASRSAGVCSLAPKPPGDRGVEAAEAKLRRHHHQPEQQGDGRHVDRHPRVVQREPAGRDERDGAEQRDAGAIERESRDLAEDHPEVDEREDADDDVDPTSSASS